MGKQGGAIAQSGLRVLVEDDMTLPGRRCGANEIAFAAVGN